MEFETMLTEKDLPAGTHVRSLDDSRQSGTVTGPSPDGKGVVVLFSPTNSCPCNPDTLEVISAAPGMEDSGKEIQDVVYEAMDAEEFIELALNILGDAKVYEDAQVRISSSRAGNDIEIIRKPMPDVDPDLAVENMITMVNRKKVVRHHPEHVHLVKHMLDLEKTRIGAVTLSTHPDVTRLDDSFEPSICSACGKNASVFRYVEPRTVLYQGRRVLVTYTFRRCSKCGSRWTNTRDHDWIREARRKINEKSGRRPDERISGLHLDGIVTELEKRILVDLIRDMSDLLPQNRRSHTELRRRIKKALEDG